MSNPCPSADSSELIMNHIYEYVSDKLKHILYEEWFTGFKFKTCPDVVGRILTLKDLCKDHGINFYEVIEDAEHNELFVHDCQQEILKAVSYE